MKGVVPGSQQNDSTSTTTTKAAATTTRARTKTLDIVCLFVDKNRKDNFLENFKRRLKKMKTKLTTTACMSSQGRFQQKRFQMS
jgi:hypothetical protein